MKITTWNCNGALRKKLEICDSLLSDVLIVQECENPNQSEIGYKRWAFNYIWEGDNKNKGIGIFAKQGVRLKRLDWNSSFTLVTGLTSLNSKLTWNTKQLRQFIPFIINDQYLCLAVWTKGSADQVFGYMGQFWKFLQIHKQELSSKNVLILGDFNSNKIWDKPDRWWSHTDVVEELEAIGLTSIYHNQTKELQGEEITPTFYHHRRLDKPYHIDYVFIGSGIKGARLEIGHTEKWLEFSDHMPLSISF
ncbi:MAG: endonuclease/exonuclease/phosphatase family protein [Aestuariibacter sp.]|nr:endonuclease/exonuclease/phosphatase family protein [Aestuariibacter sp.]MCP4052957.1 endonuclease/exonuclease/phosphatase family protein [Mesoflavibacter sp.]MCP4528881.1 endonuclease/exonuclease/phosphatase family protein [Aestuariibacter sp.]